ncbi:MAG TPA: hypothetical protein VM511_09920 [Luteolibacter sp.]|nr:hypothetical protein [Luteolibacter sp.]
MIKTLPAITLLAALLSSPAGAVVVAQYTFTSGSFTSSDSDANSAAGTITETGFTSTNTTTNAPIPGSATRAITLDQIDDTFTTDHYYQFTITPTSGTLNLGQLTFLYNTSAAGATNNSAYRLRYSDLSGPVGLFIDLGTTAYATGTTPLTGSFDLSSAAFDNLSSGITFRIDVIDSGSASSGASVRIDNIIVDTVPEPGIALLGVMGAFALIHRRKR